MFSRTVLALVSHLHDLITSYGDWLCARHIKRLLLVDLVEYCKCVLCPIPEQLSQSTLQATEKWTGDEIGRMFSSDVEHYLNSLRIEGVPCYTAEQALEAIVWPLGIISHATHTI